MADEAKACPTCPICESSDRNVVLPKCHELASKFNLKHPFHDAPPQPAPEQSICPDCKNPVESHNLYRGGLCPVVRINLTYPPPQPAQEVAGASVAPLSEQVPDTLRRTVPQDSGAEVAQIGTVFLSVQPAPAGFSTFEEAISRLKAIMSAAIYTTAEQRQVPDGMFIEIRAAHAKEVEEAREKVWALEINAEESDECAAELFSLVCAVLEGKPEAAEARVQLQKHIEHVRACRKGSCDAELYGGKRKRATPQFIRPMTIEEIMEAGAIRCEYSRCALYAVAWTDGKDPRCAMHRDKRAEKAGDGSSVLLPTATRQEDASSKGKTRLGRSDARSNRAVSTHRQPSESIVAQMKCAGHIWQAGEDWCCVCGERAPLVQPAPGGFSELLTKVCGLIGSSDGRLVVAVALTEAHRHEVAESRAAGKRETLRELFNRGSIEYSEMMDLWPAEGAGEETGA